MTPRKWLAKLGLVTPVEVVEPDYVTSTDPAVLKARIAKLEGRLRRAQTEQKILKK